MINSHTNTTQFIKDLETKSLTESYTQTPHQGSFLPPSSYKSLIITHRTREDQKAENKTLLFDLDRTTTPRFISDPFTVMGIQIMKSPIHSLSYFAYSQINAKNNKRYTRCSFIETSKCFNIHTSLAHSPTFDGFFHHRLFYLNFPISFLKNFKFEIFKLST